MRNLGRMGSWGVLRKMVGRIRGRLVFRVKIGGQKGQVGHLQVFGKVGCVGKSGNCIVFTKEGASMETQEGLDVGHFRHSPFCLMKLSKPEYQSTKFRRMLLLSNMY